jgi:hypothetical protein
MRTLPKRLEPDESWETWFPVPATEQEAYRLARIRLSSHKVVKSKQAENVPLYGAVPGA